MNAGVCKKGDNDDQNSSVPCTTASSSTNTHSVDPSFTDAGNIYTGSDQNDKET